MLSGGVITSKTGGGTTAGVGIGAAKAKTTGAGAGVGIGSGGGGGLEGAVPGFAGKDGCRSAVAVAVGAVAGTVARGPATLIGVTFSWMLAGGAGDAAADAATAAFARACAILSAVLASCFLRCSILASSILIFLTKSWTSPGLKRRKIRQR